MFNERKSMKITIEDLMRDRKENTFDAQDKISSILKFFAGSQKGNHLEKREFNEKEYRQLGWYQNEYFDVINSFYTTFVCALVAYANDIEQITQYWGERVEEHKSHDEKNKCDYIKEWTKPTFALGGLFTKDFNEITKDDTELKYLTKHDFCDIGKEKYAEKPLDSENIQYDILEDFKSTNNGKLLEELARLTHCVANFMPYPKLKIRLRGKEKELWIFNSAKGTSKAHDYLPLFVDLIQQCIDDNDNLIYDGNHKWIEFKYLDQWSDWLIANVDEYCLSCYYEVKDGKLKGKPFFKGQSLAHPYPQNAEEVNKCISNMINCIKIRAEELLYRINEQGASK